MQRLGGLDTGFLNIESDRVFAYVGSVIVLDPASTPGHALTFDAFRATVAQRLHLAPPLRRKLVEVPFGLGAPYWVDDADFDLDFHVREAAVPPPGTDRQLAELVARTFGRPFDRSRPMWEFWFVHGLPGGRVALFNKLHHALVDGISGDEVVGMVLDLGPEGRAVPPAGPWTPERHPSGVELLARGLVGTARDAVGALRLAPRMLRALPAVPGIALVPGVPTLARAVSRVADALRPDAEGGGPWTAIARAPRTAFNGPVSARRSWAHGAVALDRLKAVRAATGTTINDVVVSACAGALRSWLLTRDALPAEPLVAVVPISVRAEAAGDAYGNSIGMMPVPIGTHLADPVERLTHDAAVLRAAKKVYSGMPADLLADATNVLPPVVAARASRTVLGALSRVRPPFNLLISNVAGPREPLYCAGAEMEAYLPAPPLSDGIGINITVVSYRDQLFIGIMTDREQVDDAWPLVELIDKSLGELESAVLGEFPQKPK